MLTGKLNLSTGHTSYTSHSAFCAVHFGYPRIFSCWLLNLAATCQYPKCVPNYCCFVWLCYTERYYLSCLVDSGKITLTHNFRDLSSTIRSGHVHISEKVSNLSGQESIIILMLIWTSGQIFSSIDKDFDVLSIWTFRAIYTLKNHNYSTERLHNDYS